VGRRILCTRFLLESGRAGGWSVCLNGKRLACCVTYLSYVTKFFGSGYLSCVHLVMSFFGLKCLKCLNVLEVDCLPAVLGVVEGSYGSARCDESDAGDEKGEACVRT
jgi:hypothetical protein